MNERNPAQPLRIFLSYRREDASGHAGRLYDALTARFGADNVFMDIDTIDLGADFAEVITQAVASCDVLIALIGRQWLDATDSEGRRRLDSPDDFVRLELEAGLRRDVYVIPACVQGAAQPSPEQLPASLAALAGRHGAELRDIGWHDDVGRLIARLERLEREKGDQREERRAVQAPVRRAAGPKRLRSRGALVGFALVFAVVAAAVAAAILAARGGDVEENAAKPFPTAAESELLRVIPPITRPSCRRITWGDKAARVSVECAGARLSVRYHLFPTDAVKNAWYAQQRELAEIEPLSGTCTGRQFRGEGRYPVSAEPVGRYLCRFESEGEAQLVWIDDRSSVGAEANIYEGTGRPAAESLLRQWRCCLRVQP